MNEQTKQPTAVLKGEKNTKRPSGSKHTHDIPVFPEMQSIQHIKGFLMRMSYIYIVF